MISKFLTYKQHQLKFKWFMAINVEDLICPRWQLF